MINFEKLVWRGLEGEMTRYKANRGRKDLERLQGKLGSDDLGVSPALSSPATPDVPNGESHVGVMVFLAIADYSLI